MPVIISDGMGIKTDISSVTSRLAMQCSRREYCVSDVFAKALKALEGDRDGAQKVVESLVEDRYVDDYRYSQLFCQSHLLFKIYHLQTI